MIDERSSTVCFTGHRTYDGDGVDVLCRVIRELYARGFRRFLSGMAVGFDLAAAEAVVAYRERMPGLQLVAVVPFKGQQAHFSAADCDRYERVLMAADEVVVLSDCYYPGCYAVRNNFLVDHAALVVAWYDGSAGGTRQTVLRARKQGLEVYNSYSGEVLCAEPTLFG